jgi:23S rRNA pseudouridine1911/1915/1917 synthase
MPVHTVLHTWTVELEQSGQRLDRFLRHALPHVSRAGLREVFGRGQVRVNGHTASKGADVSAGDRVEVSGLSADPGPAPDSSVELHIVYEDSWLIAVDKPAGLPSHALRPGEHHTVVSGLLVRYPELQGVGYSALEPGLLHRLDNDTSGILLAARSEESFERLRAAHERGEFCKRYLALVAGHAKPEASRAFLRADRRKVVVRGEPFSGARSIESRIVSSMNHGPFSLVCVEVALAARHQVRAHLAHLGHPIVGDPLYGGPSWTGLDRHFLHASELEFPHPEDGRHMHLRADLSDDLRAVLASAALMTGGAAPAP